MDLGNLKFFEISDRLCNQIITFYSLIFDFLNRRFEDVLLDANNEVATTAAYLLKTIGATDLLNFSVNDLLFGAGLALVIAFTVARWAWDTFNPFN